MFFFFKQKTAYEMRISDWSSDVCSSDLLGSGSETRAIAFIDQLTVAQHEQRARLPDIVGVSEQRIGARPDRGGQSGQIGSASCRDSVCQYVYISVVAVSLKKQIKILHNIEIHNI